MGKALTPFLQRLPKQVVFSALFLMCDESWAPAFADAEKRWAAGVRPAFALPYYLGVSLAIYLVWVVYTTAVAFIAPLASPGSTAAATSRSDVEGVPVPALRREDVVVFDDLRAHPAPAGAEAIEGAGASVLPLPPYGPDFTPIEEMLSKVKGILRRIGARAKDQLHEAIGVAWRQVTAQEILGWFRQAGPCATRA
jgi:transposase